MPRGTELDFWQGHALVSLVGFSFADTRVRGISIPGHRDFEEVNLRFYVRRRLPPGPDRRAVVFIRELVPGMQSPLSPACSTTSPICLCRCTTGHASTRIGAANRVWLALRRQRVLDGCCGRRSRAELEAESEAEFITEHYWGYTRQRDVARSSKSRASALACLGDATRGIQRAGKATLRIGVRRDPRWVTAFGVCRRRIASDGVRRLPDCLDGADQRRRSSAWVKCSARISLTSAAR